MRIFLLRNTAKHRHSEIGISTSVARTVTTTVGRANTRRLGVVVKDPSRNSRTGHLTPTVCITATKGYGIGYLAATAYLITAYTSTTQYRSITFRHGPVRLTISKIIIAACCICIQFNTLGRRICRARAHQHNNHNTNSLYQNYPLYKKHHRD